MTINNSLKIKEIISNNSIIIYDNDPLHNVENYLKINVLKNNINNNCINKNVCIVNDNLNDNVNDNDNLNTSNINILINKKNKEKFDVRVDKNDKKGNVLKNFIKCKKNNKCSIFGCFKNNNKLFRLFKSKKISEKKSNSINLNIKKQLYHNLYELKKDLYLYKIKLNKNNIKQIIYFLSPYKEYGYLDFIKINANSVIQIEDSIEFNNNILNLIKQYNYNNHKNYGKYCIFAKIVDLNVDLLENFAIQTDIDDLNDSIQTIPIIVNSLFMYKTNYDNLFNHNVPENLKSHTNQNFLITIDDNINDNSLICHNSDYLKKLHSKK